MRDHHRHYSPDIQHLHDVTRADPSTPLTPLCRRSHKWHPSVWRKQSSIISSCSAFVTSYREGHHVFYSSSAQITSPRHVAGPSKETQLDKIHVDIPKRTAEGILVLTVACMCVVSSPPHLSALQLSINSRPGMEKRGSTDVDYDETNEKPFHRYVPASKIRRHQRQHRHLKRGVGIPTRHKPKCCRVTAPAGYCARTTGPPPHDTKITEKVHVIGTYTTSPTVCRMTAQTRCDSGEGTITRRRRASRQQ